MFLVLELDWVVDVCGLRIVFILRCLGFVIMMCREVCSFDILRCLELWIGFVMLRCLDLELIS